MGHACGARLILVRAEEREARVQASGSHSIAALPLLYHGCELRQEEHREKLRGRSGGCALGQWRGRVSAGPAWEKDPIAFLSDVRGAFLENNRALFLINKNLMLRK